MRPLAGYPAIRTILKLLGAHSRTLAAVAVLGVAGSFAEGFGIGLLIPLLKIILRQKADSGTTSLPFLNVISAHLQSFSPLQSVLILGAGMVVLVAIKALLTFVASALSTQVNGRINDGIRRALFGRLLRMEYEAFVCADQSRVVNTFENQVWRLLDAMLSLFDLVATMGAVLAIGLLLLLVSWPLTIAVLAMAGIIGISISRPLTRRLNRLSDVAVASTARITRRVLTTLSAMRVVRAFGREDFEQQRFEKISTDAAQVSARITLAQRIAPPLVETASIPVFVGAVVIAQIAGIPAPTLLVFLVLFIRLQPQFRSLVHDYVFLASSSAAILEIAGMLDSRDTPAGRDGSRAFSGLKDGIVFRDVSFEFRDGGERRRALSGISVEMRARQMTAIVGMSGAGKTSLINILYGFYETAKGQVLVDGVPLTDLQIATWRAHLGLAGQDASLIDGSVYENIAYGSTNAAESSVADAARSAALHEFVETLPHGYGTEVGERGVRLSEGQRQRIGLARALLRDPEILVLDEATSALDGLTESVIQQTLDRFVHQKTLIVIAHRLSTIRRADRVIVLDEGRVVEQGSPADLLRRGGEFALLYGANAEGKDADLSSNSR